MKPFYLKWLGGLLFLLLSLPRLQAQTDTLCNPNDYKKIFGEAYLIYGGVTNSYSPYNRSDFSLGQGAVTVSNLISQNFQVGLGLWSPWLLPPQPPTLFASQGDFKDRILLKWEVNPLGPAPTSFVIYRDGSFLTELGVDVRQFIDFFTQAGEFYEYSIIAKNSFGEGTAFKSIGFMNPNGVVTGKIESNSGNPVPGVEVRLTPLTGSSMSFDGVNDQLCVTYDNEFPTTAFTVSAYVKLGTGNNEAGIIDWGSTLHKNWWITTTTNAEAKGYIFHIGNGTGSDSLKYYIPNEITNPNLPNQWHQITMVYNGTAMSVMVDGNFVGTKPSTIVRTKNYLDIGSKIGGVGFYKGLIDDVRIYNRPLTQSEVNSTKNRAVSKTETGLISYFKMDEGVGLKVFDNTTLPTNAAIYGGAKFSTDIPQVYNAGISDATGYYIIDGVNYSSVESFRATPIKYSEFNSAIEFNAADKSYGNLNNYDIPDTSTVEVLFHPFDLKSRQTVLSKGSLYELYVDNGRLYLNLNGNLSDLGTIKAQYYHVAVAMDNTHGTARVYLEGELKATVSFTGTSNWATGNPWLLATNSTAPTGNFYTGLIDEVAIYKTALPQTEIQRHFVVGIPQDSTTALLYSYFDLNEGSDTKVYDYAAISFGATVPREGILTKANWSNNARRKANTPHEFEPNVRVVNLNNSNTAVGNIDFRDVSTVNISGTVRFKNTFCFSDSVQILVNGLPHSPVIITDKDGNWSADFEPGANVKLTAVYKNHVFTPGFMEFRKLQSPKAGIVFLNNTKRTLRGQVAGGKCKLSIIPANQRIVVKIKTLDGCFEKTDTLRNPDGKYVFSDLPARAFTVSVVEFNHSTFPTKTGEVVDLREALADTVDFIYTSPPLVEIDGIENNIWNFKTIGQGVSNQIKVKVYEDYAGGKCYVDGANIKIDDPSTGVLTDTTLAEGVKDFIYKFTPKNVNIIPPYETTITVTGTVNSATDTETTKFIVLGMKAKGNTFTSSTPETPLFILRDPPGDASYATLERGSSYCYSTNRTVTNNLSQEANLAVTIGGTTVIGLGLAVQSTVKATITTAGGGSQVWTNSSNSSNCITTTKVISTSANDQVIGSRDGGDVYVGITENVTYGTADELNFNFTTGNFTLTPRLTINDVRMKSDFVYSEYHIINDVIPSLQLLGSQTIAINPNRKADSVAAVMWKKYVAQNKADKGNLIKSISFDAGAVYDETISTETGSGWSESFDGSGWVSAGIGAELDFMGGFQGGVTIRNDHTTSNAVDNQTTNNVTINYHLEDDDSGDNFFVNIHKANRWTESYIFDIAAGESSCPWEYGTLPRAEPTISSVDGTSKANIPANAAAVYEISLGNVSPTNEGQSYEISLDPASNPLGAVVKIGGQVITQPISYSVPSGESVRILVTIERANSTAAYIYDDIKILLSAPCEASGKYADSLFVRSLLLDAKFIEPCSPVDISSPNQDWVITPASGSNLSININEYNINDTDLKLIRLEYRPIGGDGSWFKIHEINKADLGITNTVKDWNTTLFKDGNYEIRAVAECFSASLAPGISTVVKGQIEKLPPVLVGVPEPGDGIWDPGDEISITFNEYIDCDKIVKADILANNSIGLYDATTNLLVAATFTCVGNKIVIVPTINPKDFENRAFRVKVSGKDYDDAQIAINSNHIRAALRDRAGNMIPQSIIWEFAVNQNNLEWVGTDVIETNTVLQPFSVRRQIRNRGGTIASFRMEDIPSWLTVSPATGTLNPGQTADITLTFQQDLLIGDYLETLNLVGSKGKEPLSIDYRVRCAAPNYVVNNLAEYEGTMSMVIDLSIFGVRSTDPSDIIVAKIDGQVRGVGKVSYYRNIPADKVRWLTFMTIYGNADDIGKPVEINVWDGDKCNEYVEVLEQIVYQEGDLVGSPLVPQPIHVINLVKKCIPLNRGWNWVSFNLDLGNGNNVVSKVLASLKNKPGTIIKSDDFNARYYGNPINNWLGTLTSISPQKRYMINVAEKDTICIKGMPYVSGDFPITIKQGWNWVGYVPSTGMSVTQALNGLTPLNGDIIKSQTLFAQYIAGVGWVGNLSFLEPLKGYLMKISNAGTLVYPTGATNGPNGTNGPNNDVEISPKALAAQAAQEATMTFDFTKYQLTMNLIGKVNGMTIDDDDELRAYIDGQLVGINKSISYSNNRLFFQTIYFQDESNITFKLYKADRKKEYNLNRTIPFVAETLAGLAENPIIFDLETSNLVPISIVINDQLIWQPNKIFPTVSVVNAVSGQSASCASFTFNTILPTATETKPGCVAQTGLEGNMFGVMKINYNERSTFVSSNDVLSFVNPATGLTVGCGIFDSQFNVFNFTVKGGVSSTETPIDVKYYSDLMKKSFTIKSGIMYRNNRELGDYITPSPLDVSPLSVSINAGVITAVLRDTSWIGKYCLDAFALNCPNFSDGQTTFCFQRLKQGACVDVIVRNITESTNDIIKAVSISSEVIVNSGIRLEYKGGNKIELKPGFETKAGTVFIGKIEGCSN